MAKTLKTGDVLKFPHDEATGFVDGGWAVVSPTDGLITMLTSRIEARGFRNATYEIGDRIAKVIKRTAKYLHLEVSK